MDRIERFLEHARECMEMAGKTSGTQSDALVRIAEYGTALARDRREQLEATATAPRASIPCPSPRAQEDSELH